MVLKKLTVAAALTGLLTSQVSLAQSGYGQEMSASQRNLMLQMIQGGVRDSSGVTNHIRKRLIDGGLSNAQADRVVSEIDREASRTRSNALNSIGPALQNLERSQVGDSDANRLTASRARTILANQ